MIRASHECKVCKALCSKEYQIRYGLLNWVCYNAFFQRNGFRVWDWYTRNSMIQWRPNDSQGLRFGFRWIGAIPGEPTLAERNTVVSIQNKHLKVADFFQKVEVTDPRHHRLMVCSWFRPIYIYIFFRICQCMIHVDEHVNPDLETQTFFFTEASH